MKITVTKYNFIDSFPSGYQDNFSHDGKLSLFEYLNELEDSCGVEIELDPVALYCEFGEYINLAQFHEDYNKEEYPTLEALAEYTQVIPISGTDRFIIRIF